MLRPRALSTAPRLVAAVALLVVGLVAVTLAPVRPAAAATGWEPLGGTRHVQEHNFATDGEGANDVVVGPDGRLWITFGISGTIGALGADGSRSTYPASSATASPFAITVGPDGALWFTEPGTHQVARMTTDGSRTDYPLAAGSKPTDITVGPDGALWFTELGAAAVGRITTSGELTEMALPAGTEDPYGITTGADGNLWVTVSGGVARLVPGGSTTVFPISRPDAKPSAIAAGPDGATYYVDYAASQLGVVTTSGAITEHALPAGSLPSAVLNTDEGLWLSLQGTEAVARVSTTGDVLESVPLTTDAGPLGLAEGADGIIWVAEAEGSRVGAVIPGPSPLEVLPLPDGTGAGTVLVDDDGTTWFTTATGIGSATADGTTAFVDVTSADPDPAGLAFGPDGNLWETLRSVDRIARITPDGVVTEFPIAGTHDEPAGITAGPDGALWFTLNGSDEIGRITVDGDITTYALPSGASEPSGIVTGADGRLWFALFGSSALGAITTDGEITTYPLLGDGIQPDLVTLGSDGDVWYSGFQFGSVGRVTPTGTVSAWDLQTMVLGIDAGSGPGVWFAYYLAQSMGHFDPSTGADLVGVPRGELPSISVGSNHVVLAIDIDGTSALYRLDLATPLTPPLQPITPPPSPSPAPGPPPAPVVTPSFTG